MFVSVKHFKKVLLTTFALFSIGGVNALSASCECDDEGCPATAYMNRVVHFEIHADDPESVANFYSDVFGWEIVKWDNPEHDYWLVMTGPHNAAGGINGGITRRMGPKPVGGEAVTSFVCTMAVDNVAEMSEKIENAGGKITVPTMGIPQVGWLAYCTDPDGNTFGIMQADPEAK